MAHCCHAAQHPVGQRRFVVFLGHVHRHIKIGATVRVLMIVARLLLIAGAFVAHRMRIGDGAKGGGRQEQCRNNEPR